ncbi:hypothetical protein PHISP_03814 [Aspergillus sp. HF37]|nr:hypothetical protein PHISP_03814 [Aspergillus sp. HF37]
MSDDKNEKSTDNVEQVSTSPSNTSKTEEDHRLDALDQLEVLPQVLQEGIVFAGSGTALLLQASMPGVRNQDTSAHHKNLATELGDALQAFLAYVSCLVFGSRHERKTLMDMLQRGEPPLKASDYYAANPDAQVWIAATLYATSTDVYQRIYGRVNYRSARKIYAEFTFLMSYLGLPVGSSAWPESRQAFWTYWDDRIDKLVVTPDSHQFAMDLFNDDAMPRWVKLVKPLLRVATIEMLPPRIREDYGLKSTPYTRGLYRTAMGFSVAAYPALPTSLRSYAPRYYLDDLRRHLNVV